MDRLVHQRRTVFALPRSTPRGIAVVRLVSVPLEHEVAADGTPDLARLDGFVCPQGRRPEPAHEDHSEPDICLAGRLNRAVSLRQIHRHRLLDNGVLPYGSGHEGCGQVERRVRAHCYCLDTRVVDDRTRIGVVVRDPMILRKRGSLLPIKVGTRDQFALALGLE